MKWRHARHEISDDEHLARYAYVLGNVPAGVADKAYAAAFEQLPAEQREQIVGELRMQLPAGSHEAAPDDPEAFSTLMRDLHARHAVVTVNGAAALAAGFVTSPSIVAYFTSGAGSVSIDQQPAWLHELAGHETAPIDGGRISHHKGPDVLGI